MFRETDRDEWARSEPMGTGLLEQEDANGACAAESDEAGGAEGLPDELVGLAGALATRADARRKAGDEDVDDDFDDDEDEFEDEEDDLEEDFDEDFDENEDLEEDVEEDVEEEDL